MIVSIVESKFHVGVANMSSICHRTRALITSAFFPRKRESGGSYETGTGTSRQEVKQKITSTSLSRNRKDVTIELFHGKEHFVLI